MTAELAAPESAPLSHFDRSVLRPHKWEDTEVIPPKALEGDAPSAPNIPARECGHIVFDGKIPVSRIDTWVAAVAIKSPRWGCWRRRGRRRSEQELFFVSLSHHNRQASGTTFSSLF